MKAFCWLRRTRSRPSRSSVPNEATACCQSEACYGLLLAIRRRNFWNHFCECDGIPEQTFANSPQDVKGVSAHSWSRQPSVSRQTAKMSFHFCGADSPLSARCRRPCFVSMKVAQGLLHGSFPAAACGKSLPPPQPSAFTAGVGILPQVCVCVRKRVRAAVSYQP